MRTGERHGAKDVQEKEHGEARRQRPQRLQGQGRMAARKAVAVAVFVLAAVAQLGAQILTNIRVEWDPNPAAENVTSYTVVLNGAAPVTVAASACSATVCGAPFTGLPLGTHTVTVTAVNEWGAAAAAPVTFTINVPTVVKNVKAKKAS
jgi:predicted phage tail protein